MPDKIVCLVGESGSGKTTIAKLLEERGYNVIKSYTTRLPREPEEWGHEFVRLDTYWVHNIVAETEFDGNKYWATVKQYKGKGTSIYIIDPAGVEDLKEKITDAEIVVIYLRVEKNLRYYRLLEREAEVRGKMLNRILALNRSEKDFEMFKEIDYVATKRSEHDEEKFKLIWCDWVVDNNGEIEGAVEAITGIVGGERNEHDQENQHRASRANHRD